MKYVRFIIGGLIHAKFEEWNYTNQNGNSADFERVAFSVMQNI
jgi:hypothetical protein